MWQRWQFRVGVALVAGLMMPLGLALVALAVLATLGEAVCLPYVIVIVGLGSLVLSPSLVVLSLQRNWGLSILLGILSLGVVYLAIEIWDTGKLNTLLPFCFTCDDTVQLSFPLMAMTAFLLVASGRVTNLQCVAALVVALSGAFVITLSAEQATSQVMIAGHRLSLSLVTFLWPSLAFSLSVLSNISVRERIRWHMTLLSAGLVIAVGLVLSLMLGYIFAF